MQHLDGKLDKSKVIQTGCALCIASCGMNVHVEGDRIVKVTGMPEHPLSRGRLCPKGAHAINYVYSPDRLHYPMKKDNGTWKRITWDEALDTIAAKLQKIREDYGARALAVFFGMPQLGQGIAVQSIIRRFTDLYGTPNVFSVDSMCFRHRMVGHILTLGKYSIADPENAECIIVWGHNPHSSCPPLARLILNGVEKGAKLIVIDPRSTPLAQIADIHVQPKPGSDCALALGILNVIISEKLYAKEFVEKWTIGFENLAAHIEQFSPEEVAAETWIPAEAIRRIAHIFATSKPSCIVQGINSLDQHETGVQTARAIAALQAITGNFDVAGGFTTSSALHLTPLRYLDRLEERPLGSNSFPLFYEVLGRLFGEGQLMSLPDAILTDEPYPIKAMIVSASNPLSTWPDTRKVEQALRKLDLLVVFDLFMTQTAGLADIVIPAASFMERTSICDIYRLLAPVPYVMLGKRIIEPLGECWSDLKFWLELAKRMGYGEYFPWRDDDEAIDHILEPSGLTIKHLTDVNPGGVFFGSIQYKQYEQRGFQTPSGKVELYSETLANLGLEPLPTPHRFRESLRGDAEFSREFPLILTTGSRMLEYTHSQFHNITQLQKLAPEPAVEIHPHTADIYGVTDGEFVIVETERGSIEIRSKVTKTIVPNVLNLPHGWSQANANRLTDGRPADPVTGCPALKALPCRLKRPGEMVQTKSSLLK